MRYRDPSGFDILLFCAKISRFVARFSKMRSHPAPCADSRREARRKFAQSAFPGLQAKQRLQVEIELLAIGRKCFVDAFVCISTIAELTSVVFVCGSGASVCLQR